MSSFGFRVWQAALRCLFGLLHAMASLVSALACSFLSHGSVQRRGLDACRYQAALLRCFKSLRLSPLVTRLLAGQRHHLSAARSSFGMLLQDDVSLGGPTATLAVSPNCTMSVRTVCTVGAPTLHTLGLLCCGPCAVVPVLCPLRCDSCVVAPWLCFPSDALPFFKPTTPSK